MDNLSISQIEMKRLFFYYLTILPFNEYNYHPSHALVHLSGQRLFKSTFSTI